MEIKEWLALDNLIKEQEILIQNAEDSIEYDIAKACRDYFIELKQRRESDLRPADKFLGNCTAQQLKHMESELKEIYKEFNEVAIEKWSLDRFVEEIVDLQMSCETMLAILGLDENKRQEARRKVIAKNEARGHYQVNSKEAE